MSEAYVCDRCGTRTVKGSPDYRAWFSVGRDRQSMLYARADDPLRRPRHFCSFPCASAWFRLVEDHAGGSMVPLDAPAPLVSEEPLDVVAADVAGGGGGTAAGPGADESSADGQSGGGRLSSLLRSRQDETTDLRDLEDDTASSGRRGRGRRRRDSNKSG